MKPANRITEENLSQPVPERQSLIDIDGQKVWIDNDFIDLIRALNEAGLKTRSHCAGHGHPHAWVIIRTDNITGVEIRNDDPYKEIVIQWIRNEQVEDDR